MAYRAINAKGEQHEKEDDRPEWSEWHHTYSLWVRHKDQAWSRLNHLVNRLSLYIGHVTKS